MYDGSYFAQNNACRCGTVVIVIMHFLIYSKKLFMTVVCFRLENTRERNLVFSKGTLWRFVELMESSQFFAHSLRKVNSSLH